MKMPIWLMLVSCAACGAQPVTQTQVDDTVDTLPAPEPDPAGAKVCADGTGPDKTGACAMIQWDMIPYSTFWQTSIEYPTGHINGGDPNVAYVMVGINLQNLDRKALCPPLSSMTLYTKAGKAYGEDPILSVPIWRGGTFVECLDPKMSTTGWLVFAGVPAGQDLTGSLVRLEASGTAVISANTGATFVIPKP